MTSVRTGFGRCGWYASTMPSDQCPSPQFYGMTVPPTKMTVPWTDSSSQITQQCVPLFAHRTQPLPASTGVFARDHADVTSQRFPIAERQRIAQEHFGG